MSTKDVKRILLVTLMACATFLGSINLIGCFDDEEEAAGLEIVGVWDDNFGGKHTITENTWVMNYGSDTNADIIEYSNDGNIAYVFYKNGYSPNTYSRMRWTSITNDVFYYCEEIYAKATLAEAKSDTTKADATNPASGGCGGFAWTEMTKAK
jgi:hypothetical protein